MGKDYIKTHKFKKSPPQKKFPKLSNIQKMGKRHKHTVHRCYMRDQYIYENMINFIVIRESESESCSVLSDSLQPH